MNISPFLNKLKARLNESKKQHGYNHFKEYDVVATEGSKYFKVYRREIPNDEDKGENLNIQAKSIVCFIDKTTGGIYKPATYNAPAKHVRGFVTSVEDGMEAIGPDGFVYYLR